MLPPGPPGLYALACWDRITSKCVLACSLGRRSLKRRMHLYVGCFSYYIMRVWELAQKRTPRLKNERSCQVTVTLLCIMSNAILCSTHYLENATRCRYALQRRMHSGVNRFSILFGDLHKHNAISKNEGLCSCVCCHVGCFMLWKRLHLNVDVN